MADRDNLPIALVGYGRMGRAIDALALAQRCDVVARIALADARAGAGIDSPALDRAVVALDFSVASAAPDNVQRLVGRGLDVVVGTTGWDDHVSHVRRVAEAAGVGVVHAPSFSPGVNLFLAIVERAAALFASREDFGAWIHEAHHVVKRDAPSGTALALAAAMREVGYSGAVDVASTRAGHLPGTHTVGFDGLFDTITLTHAARDRATFARGALEAARWVRGRRGWFSMPDVLGLS